MSGDFDADRPDRRSLRLSGWDYASPGAYFVTICTYDRANLFEDQRLRKVAENAWLAIRMHPHGRHVMLDEWILMPDHLHGILVLGDTVEAAGAVATAPEMAPSRLPRPYEFAAPGGLVVSSLGAIIATFKSLTAKRINNLRRTPGGHVWQRGYYDHIIRNQRELDALRQYIQENPLRCDEDRENLEALIAKMWLAT